MELVYFILACKNDAITDIETGKILEEEHEEVINVALHELGNWLNQNFDRFKHINVISRVIERVYTEDEHNEEMDELRDAYDDKISNARDFIDNVMNHLDDLRTTVSDIEYYCDEANEDCEYAQQELD